MSVLAAEQPNYAKGLISHNPVEFGGIKIQPSAHIPQYPAYAWVDNLLGVWLTYGECRGQVERNFIKNPDGTMTRRGLPRAFWDAINGAKNSEVKS